MDDATKERFKWKFYKLTLLLNVVILFYALAVMALFKGGGFALPLFAALVIAASVLALVFMRLYRKEKTWLMAQS